MSTESELRSESGQRAKINRLGKHHWAQRGFASIFRNQTLQISESRLSLRGLNKGMLPLWRWADGGGLDIASSPWPVCNTFTLVLIRHGKYHPCSFSVSQDPSSWQAELWTAGTRAHHEYCSWLCLHACTWPPIRKRFKIAAVGVSGYKEINNKKKTTVNSCTLLMYFTPSGQVVFSLGLDVSNLSAHQAYLSWLITSSCT